MAERVIRTPDFPAFDTYPDAIPADRTLPAAEPASVRLTGTAKQIGGAVGNAVHRLRHAPDALRRGFTVIRGRGRAQMESKTQEWKARTEEWKQTAEEQGRRAQRRIRHLIDERPLQVLAGVAGAAFVAGFVLRLWRGNRG